MFQISGLAATRARPPLTTAEGHGVFKCYQRLIVSHEQLPGVTSYHGSAFDHVCRHDMLLKSILQRPVDGSRRRGRPY